MRRVFAIAGVLVAGATCLGMASVAGAASMRSLRPGGLPMIQDQIGTQIPSGTPTYSLNWSGYAAFSTSKFNYVFSTFVQPSVTCNGTTPEATSNWVGLDGYTDGTVEQDGTDAICGGAGGTTPTYKAWYEMYPAGSVNVFSVKPGDVMASSVRYANHKFNLTISDLTSGKTFTDVAGCNSCERTSAEWIIERPAFCANQSCSQAELAALPNFGSTTMSNDIATAGTTKKAPISSFANSPIEGVYNLDDNENPDSTGFISVDTTGALSPIPQSFTMTFNRSGEPVPITL
jgi:hypothetical protein